MPLQPILPHLLCPLQPIAAHERQHVPPHDPVEEPNPEDCPAGNGVGPVRKVDVRLAPWGRPDEGDDEEEDVRRPKERGRPDGERRWALPVGEGAEVEVDDPEGDDCVDDGERVRDLMYVSVRMKTCLRKKGSER